MIMIYKTVCCLWNLLCNEEKWKQNGTLQLTFASNNFHTRSEISRKVKETTDEEAFLLPTLITTDKKAPSPMKWGKILNKTHQCPPAVDTWMKYKWSSNGFFSIFINHYAMKEHENMFHFNAQKGCNCSHATTSTSIPHIHSSQNIVTAWMPNLKSD